jgi:cytochrome b6-f complex iron-sulfur subunit
MKKEYNHKAVPTEGEMTRGAFLKAAAGGVGLCYAAAAGYPIYRYLSSPIEKVESAATVSEVTVPDGQKLAKGEAKMFKFGAKPAMLIHHQDDSWVALIAVCTHLGCTAQYESAKNRIFCACHGGVYDPKTGGNVSGPPPRPLTRLEVKVTADGVVVTQNPTAKT